MEIAEFVMDQIWTLFAVLLIGVEAWYYFVIPGLKSLRNKDENKGGKSKRDS